MSEKFEVGDVVQLKSGGPKFTVSFVDPKTGEVSLMGFPNKIDPKTWGPVPMGVLKRISETPERLASSQVAEEGVSRPVSSFDQAIREYAMLSAVRKEIVPPILEEIARSKEHLEGIAAACKERYISPMLEELARSRSEGPSGIAALAELNHLKMLNVNTETSSD